jgi:hypothetical protein
MDWFQFAMDLLGDSPEGYMEHQRRERGLPRGH